MKNLILFLAVFLLAVPMAQGQVVNVDKTTIHATSGTISGTTITGGTIDGATIGGSTPAAGTFTDITADSYVSTSTVARLIPSNLFSIAYQDSADAFSTRAVAADTSMTATLDRQYWDFVHIATPTTHATGVSTVIYPEPANPDSITFRMYATALTDTVQVRVRIKSGATNTFNSDWVSVSAISTWEHKAFIAPVMTANTPYEVLIEARISGNKRACVAGLTYK